MSSNEIKFDVNDQRTELTFEELSRIFQDYYLDGQYEKEIGEDTSNIKIKENKDGSYTMKVTLRELIFNIPKPSDTHDLIKQALSEAEEERDKYDWSDILKLAYDKLKDELKNFTKKSYKNFGDMRYDYLVFLNNRNLLADDVRIDFENMSANPKNVRQLLENVSDELDLKQKLYSK